MLIDIYFEVINTLSSVDSNMKLNFIKNFKIYLVK